MKKRTKILNQPLQGDDLNVVYRKGIMEGIVSIFVLTTIHIYLYHYALKKGECERDRDL